jgi:nitroimidazol reductase NimA-like FMN-containing flavoprotein (pyridoxamine 5'-phosphate oxidase superfamily)
VILVKTEMSPEEIRKYLSQPLIARLATTDEGWPHVTSVWFEYDGEDFWVPIQATTKKATHVKKDKRVGLIIDTFTEPISKFNITQVVVKGEAELIKVPSDDSPNSLRSRTMSVWHRYLGDEPEETLKKRLKIERYLIKIRPVKMVAIRDRW